MFNVQCSIIIPIGLPNTNMAADLKVEHQNADFKEGLIHLAGNFLRMKEQHYIYND